MLTLLNDVQTASRIRYDASFLPRERADQLYAHAHASSPWQQEAPVMFGRAVTTRRMTCAFGNPGRRYRYSGVERAADIWPIWLVELKDSLCALLRASFDFVLCNLYPDGRVGLGWHSDDERDLVRDSTIASISLGAERDFAFRARAHKSSVVTTTLAHGSLLTMEGATQRFYQHRVPPRLRCMVPRINLTFRCMQAESGHKKMD